MKGKESGTKKEDILRVASELFIQKGYEKTSMRQIAADAGISLGLASYHFKSKRDLATEITQRIFAKMVRLTKLMVNQKTDPFLYSAVLIRLNNTMLSQEKYLQFYKDILKEDIWTDVITGGSVDTSFCIRDKYCPTLSDEETERFGWYCNYISASMERTLVLYGDKRPLISGTIAEFIIKSALNMWSFPNAREEITRACKESERIAAKLISMDRAAMNSIEYVSA